MPLSRYEIRNEYNLADPELYRAADKDDPEALLEGVAMAGLVGILRQLGDLAEFAAEIFHDLHEEVIATAARGHGLMIRVQGLESEVPSIEKAFFSQTDHSSFFYNAGVDWHPNLQMNQNLVTQGDLPRFVMDSYEECRGPPRLFLLDKFDVAGAGSCLKRYTDPSFFKVETSGIASADVQREKKSRKAKKRGPHWRNGETPELLPASHAKLHQLFLEECVENGVSNPARRVKLKRMLNGYPFDSKTGKSYMEKLLKSSSPERKVFHDVSANSPLLMLSSVDQNESGFEVREVCQGRESIKRKNSSPPDEDEIMLNPSMYQSYEVSKYDKISEVPNSYATMVTDGISSTFDRATGVKDIAVDGETKTEDNLIDYQSDDIASEVDNYVDAPSTIDSEIDTDSEMKLKNNSSSLLNKTQPLISDPDEDLHNRSSDSQSVEESIMSDERNSSSKKETSSFSTSDSPSVSAENTKSKAISEIDKDDDPLHYRRTSDEDIPVHQNPNPLISDHKCTSTEAITNHRSDFEQLASSFFSTDLPPTLEHLNSGVVGKNRAGEPESDDFASVSDVERKVNLVIGGPCTPGVSDFASQSGDDNRRSFADEQAVDELSGENIPHEDTVSDDHTNSLVVRYSDLSPEECDCEDLNLIENIASSSNTATENAKLGRLDRKLTEIFWSGRHDKAHFDDDTMSTVSKMEKPTDQLDNEDSNVFADASNRFSHTMENSLVKELTETSLSIELLDLATEEHFCDRSIDNQIDSENLILPQIGNSPECLGEAFDAHERNVPEEELTVNENLALGISESCKVVCLSGEEVTDLPPEIAALESVSPENLEEISAVLDNVENDEITSCTNPIEDEVDKILDSSDIKLVDYISVLLDESASEIGLLVPEKMAHLTPAVSENANENNVSLPVVLDKSVKESTLCSEDSDLGEHKDARNCLWETQKESVLVRQVGEREVTASDVDIIISNSPNNGTVESDASKNIPNLYFDLDVEETFDFVDGTTIQPPLAQSDLDAEQEIIQQNGLPTCVSDPSSSPTDIPSEERISQEKIELPSSQLDEEVINSREISSGLSPFWPIELPEHDDKKVDNNSDITDPVFSCITYRSPPFSEVPGLSNCNIDVSKYLDDSLGSISNLIFETNEINLDELPPLPPLPPVQWRMGKFQLGSAYTNGKLIKPELFPQVNFPPIGSTDAVSSSLEDMNYSVVQVAPETAEKVEQSLSSLDANSVLETIDLQSVKQNEPHQPAASTDDVSSSLEETNHSLIQIVVETASKIEKVDLPMNDAVDLPSKIENKITTNSVLETIDLQSVKQNEPHQPAASTDDVSSSLEETNHSLIQIVIETASKIEKVDLPMNDAVDFPPKIENKITTKDGVSSSLEKIDCSLLHINPETALKAENVQPSSSSSNPDAIHETIDLPPKIETEQRKLIMPFLTSELTPPAEEVEVVNGSRKLKLPRPRNPFIDDVVALDKSKLRKVTERVRPQIQQVDKRDSLLEQIRTKSFNLKPAMASRPSIRGPRTNLKVAAILEKANAIRQALAGSDEDDEDNWSDS